MFYLTNEGYFTRDEYGIELESDDEARDQAVALLPDIARDEFPDRDNHAITVQVRDEAGAIIYDASLVLKGEWRSGRG